MQNHNDTIITSDTVLRKIYLSLYLKGLCVRGSWRPNRTATYWPPLLWPSVFLSRSPGLLNRGPGVPASLGASFLYRISSPTHLIPNWSDLQNWLNFLCTELYNSSTPTFFLWRRKLHSFNPSTVKVILCYSSTGCTCYLHRCISYFDSPAGSEVNIQQENLLVVGQVKSFKTLLAGKVEYADCTSAEGKDLDITLYITLYLMVRLRSWSFGKCVVSFYCHVYFDLEK